VLFERQIAKMIESGNLEWAASELERKTSGSHKVNIRHENLLAICHAKLGDLGKAEWLLSSALFHHPEDVRTLNNLGNVELLLGRTQTALNLYKKAVVADPFAKEPRYNMCLAYLQLVYFDKALYTYHEYDLIRKYSTIGKFVFFGAIAILISLFVYLALA